MGDNVKLEKVKWTAGALVVCGLLIALLSRPVVREPLKLGMLILALTVLLAGCAVMIFGFRCPVCGSRIGLKYRSVLGMTHCPDCGADLYSQNG